MARICKLTDLQPGLPIVMTIGVFDGVHRGHQALIGQTAQLARSMGGQSAVLTFYPHPRAVLAPGSPVFELTSFAERLRLLAAQGVDIVATLEFTHDLSQLSAEDFISLLQAHVNLRALCVGPDFALGRNRAGTVARLAEMGAERGFTVAPQPLLDIDGGKVSSSRVRELMLAGDVEEAAKLLGRLPYLEGTVIGGDQHGRTLGFPTANLSLAAPYLLPANGIYAVLAELGGERLPAVANIGVRPTFGVNARLVEVYLLDFERDIYGQRLGVYWVKKLRAELRFAVIQDLVTQMHKDVAQTREILAALAPHNDNEA